MIEIKNLTKQYPNGRIANNNINISVYPGDVLGLIGANGSGKTTLFRQMFSILSITKGEILVDGISSKAELFAYMPQASVIFPSLTVRESIYAALRYQGFNNTEIKRKIKDILEITGLDKYAEDYSITLSGGQLKLLSFAIIIASDKKYWILDEPTSMVDIVTKNKVWSLIEKNKRDRTVIIASHDMAEVKRLCNRLIVINNGSITHEEEIMAEENYDCFYERMMNYVDGN